MPMAQGLEKTYALCVFTFLSRSHVYATHSAAPWSVIIHSSDIQYHLNIPLLLSLPLSEDKDGRINCVMLDNPAGRYASFSQIITSSAWSAAWSKRKSRRKRKGETGVGGGSRKKRMHAGNDKCKSAWLGVASPQNVIFILHRHCVLQLCAE